MSWVTDPELFLHSKAGGDVHLWRCKKTSNVVPMSPDDFKDEGKVTNHLNLVGNIFEWDQHYYKDLIDYISPRHFLVNVQGLVIVELYKCGKDGKMNEKEIPIYVRSLDVLSLHPYGLTERLVPSRTVKYLQDKNGRAAKMDYSPNEMKLQNELNREKSENQALKKKIAKLQDEINTLKLKGKDEDWMNGHTGSDWRSVEELYEFKRPGAILTVIGSRGTFTVEDDKTNVHADYYYKIKFDFFGIPMKAVLIEDLTPNKEKARFHRTWFSFKYDGKIYVCRNLTAGDRGV